MQQLESLRTPANGARFFDTRDQAIRQPTGEIKFSWSVSDPFLFNSAFDSSLIHYDSDYRTPNADIDGRDSVPTASYFTSLEKYLPSTPAIVDIGCGQGEFVNYLRESGHDAVGFDPVLRISEPHLHRRYWDPSDEPADLYVMRCVLPHIPEPWTFVQSIAYSSPGSLALIEFQQLEWIIENSIWYQFGHGHVNFFSVADFERRYVVVDKGVFAEGEWAWVLIEADSYCPATPRACDIEEELEVLLLNRQVMLENARGLDCPIAIWGGGRQRNCASARPSRSGSHAAHSN